MKVLRGTSIIEIVIATALISMAIIAALSLANHSQKQNTYARGLAEATKYTTQAVDWIREQRTTLGWATIASLPSNTYCLNTLPAEFTEMVVGSCSANDYIPGTKLKFQRTLNLTQTAGKIKANVKVSWIEGNNVERQATIETELTQW